jgi:hypothetical protein
MIVAGLLAACSPSSAPTAAPAQPVDTTPQKAAVADPGEPVASGNTPAAADVAAIAALIIGSSIVMTVSGGPTLLGLPAFGRLGFLGAVVGGLWLLRSVWRSHHRRDEED